MEPGLNNYASARRLDKIWSLYALGFTINILKRILDVSN